MWSTVINKSLTLKNTCFLISAILLTGCSVLTYPKKNKYPTTKPFLYETPLPEIKGGNFSKEERKNLQLRLATQLHDSSKVIVTNKYFIFHPKVNLAVYDSAYSIQSVKNIRANMLHLGYYGAKVRYTDTIIRHNETQQRVTVKYFVEAGNPTIIDTFSYKLKKPELQQLALQTKDKSFIEQGKPITKANILGEINRLVELYRNNGYYKFTTDELRMRGDTTIEALTSVSDDPFESIRLLAEANEKRNKPSIKLALVINPESDSSKLMKYAINTIHIYPDYSGDDSASLSNYKLDTIYTKDDSLFQYPYILHFKNNIVKSKFLLDNILFKKGDLYRQEDYNRIVNNFSRTGVWQNINVQMTERKDSLGKIDMFVQLAPSIKYGFEGKIEASYSTSSNSNSVNIANTGNLLGLSGNISAQSRNAGRQGIKITHSLRTGVELNLNARPNAENFINSSDVGYNLTVAIPKIVLPNNIRDFITRKEKKKIDNLYSKQSFVSINANNTNRIGLFKLNSIGLGTGWEWSPKPNRTFSFKLLNVEYSNLYNRSFAFDSTINENPFLRYSFNTALVFGHTFSWSEIKYNPRHPNRVFSFKLNVEESGFLLGLPLKDIGAVNKDLRSFFKADWEGTYSIKKTKKEIAFRLFAGVGLPIGSGDSTLPFFKQYFGGGPNSMRAWPLRGIGPGSKPQPAFGPNKSLNDRTGDFRFEMNAEYRRDIAQIIPNTLTLKWALFADVGNVWNFRNTQPGGGYDSTQFRFKNFYKELGANVGTGFRFDFNYVTLRFDFGFRVKRPELQENAGWKLPSIGFDDLWGKLFQKGPNNEYRKWRYENFNFTIGLNYPF